MHDMLESIIIQRKTISVKDRHSRNMKHTRQKEVCCHQNTDDAEVEWKSGSFNLLKPEFSFGGHFVLFFYLLVLGPNTYNK